MTPKDKEKALKLASITNTLYWRSVYAGAILLMGIVLFGFIIYFLCKGQYEQVKVGGGLEGAWGLLGWNTVLKFYFKEND